MLVLKLLTCLKKTKGCLLDDKDELDIEESNNPLSMFEIPGQPGSNIGMMNLNDIFEKLLGKRQKK